MHTIRTYAALASPSRSRGYAPRAPRLLGALRFATLASVALVAPYAHAQTTGDVEIVKSQFTDKVEQSNPVAGQDQLSSATRVTYWVAVKNAKEATTITLVWKLDGKEAGRQTLDVGTSPSWKTWGTHARAGAHEIEVDVLDKSGNEIKKDTLSF